MSPSAPPAGTQRRPLVLAPVTLIVAGALAAAGRKPEAAVWFAFALIGTVLAVRLRRGQVWPFWASLGLVAAVSGSFASTGSGFQWISALAGLTLAIALCVAALIGAARLVPGSSSGLEVAAALGRGLCGFPATRWEVDGGALVARGPLYGEAVLSVPDGWVVATRRDGQFARLVTSRHGMLSLTPGETPHRAVPCGIVSAGGTLHQLLTRDVVRVAAIEWQLECQVRARTDDSPQPGEPYPYDPYAVRQAAWGPQDLVAAVDSAASKAIAQAIRQVPMAALFDPSGASVPLEEALESARIALSSHLGAWGFALRELRAVRIELSEDVQDHLTAVWHAKTERQVRALTRETELAARTPPTAAAAERHVEDPGAPIESPWSGGSDVERPRLETDPPTAGELGALVSAFEGSLRGKRRSRNPVSFGQFLGTLRQRAESGDDTAGSVLRQVLDVMSRLEPGNPTRVPREPEQDEGDPGGPGDAAHATPDDASPSEEPNPPSGEQQRLL